MNRSAAILVLAAVAIIYAVGLATRPAEPNTAIHQRPTQLSEADRRTLGHELGAQSQPGLPCVLVSVEVVPVDLPR
jgi:hypothetical protein